MKKGVFKNFAKFNGKYVSQSLFNKCAGCRRSILSKREYSCFVAKFSRTSNLKDFGEPLLP